MLSEMRSGAYPHPLCIIENGIATKIAISYSKKINVAAIRNFGSLDALAWGWPSELLGRRVALARCKCRPKAEKEWRPALTRMI
jgi:hypothetical protein